MTADGSRVVAIVVSLAGCILIALGLRAGVAVLHASLAPPDTLSDSQVGLTIVFLVVGLWLLVGGLVMTGARRDRP
jgi:hypothetical protein